jgi:hypothetical protein
MSRQPLFLFVATLGLMSLLACRPAHAQATATTLNAVPAGPAQAAGTTLEAVPAAPAHATDSALDVVPAAHTEASFSEQTLPGQDAPSPSPSPGAAVSPNAAASPAASGGTNGATADWERVPNGAAAASPVPGAAYGAPSQVTDVSTGTAPAAGVAPVDTSPPPALDVSTITGDLDPSQGPLTDEIKHADNPALMASLRQTEQARKELAAGNLDEALRSLNGAVSIDPSNPFAYFYLGRSYAARKDFPQALTFFKRAEVGFGSHPEWLGATMGNEGTCYEELNQMNNAARAYRNALAASPNNLMARTGYGRLGEEFPDTSSAANPATPPEAVSDTSTNPVETSPAPEEAQPPPPPDVPPAEELPTSVKPAPGSPD